MIRRNCDSRNGVSAFSRCLKAVCFLTAIMAFLFLASECQACPTCKEGLKNESNDVQLGYVISILFMMSMPMLIFAGWAIVIVRAMRAQSKLAAELVTNLAVPQETSS